jgi:hypothetical protein
MKKKSIYIISLLLATCLIVLFITWYGKIGEYQLRLKSTIWSVTSHDSSFSFGKFTGNIPEEYFIYKFSDTCLMLIKIKPMNQRNPMENFEGPNIHYYTSGIAIYNKSEYIGNKAKENYYKILSGLIKLGSLSKSNKDTIAINGHFFEGIDLSYFNFNTGEYFYFWDLSKNDLMNTFKFSYK